MPHDPEKYLEDMLDRASFLLQLLHDKSAGDVEADRVLRSAVEREFSIIGEALMQLHRLAPDLAEQIDQWERIIGFRHVLVHGYGIVKMEVVVSIAHDELPALIATVKQLLSEPK